jgi:hypothetical protein
MMRRLILLACLGTGYLSAQLQLFYVQGTYQAQITVPQYSFGTVSTGDSREVQFNLTNNGTAPTPLTTLTVGAPFSILYGPSLPQTVPVGGAVSFTVSFSPTAAGSFSSTLAADGVSLVVVGTAISAVAISVGDGTNPPVPLDAGASIDFGSSAQGSTASRQVVMTNTTQATLTVQNIAVVNMQGASFQMPPVGLPISLDPGGSVTLEVDFTPASVGPQQGALEIDQRSITLTGVGLAPPFPQPIILVSIPSPASSQQGTLTVSLPSASQASGTGQVQMAFTPSSPSANADSGIIFLLNGSQSVPFSVHQGDTAGQFGTAGSVAFQTGTTAGTIVFTVTLGSFTGTYSLTIPAAPAGIDTTTAQYTSGGLDLEITAFDNTRTASTLTFTFLDANGATLNGGPITVDGTTGFQQFFPTSDDGGIFALHAFFPVTAGNPSQVDSVEIQITNSAGTTPTTKVYFTTP